MKIGILRLPLGIGGAEMSLTEMGAVLKDSGHDVWFYFDDGGSHSSMKDFNKFGSVKERCSSSSKSFFCENALNEDWAINNLKNTDVIIMIHRHLFSKKLAAAANSVKSKIVYAPGKNEHHIYGFYPGIEGYGRNIKPIKNIIFNSKHTFNLHKNKSYPDDVKKKFKHIHPPMDLKFYSNVSLDSKTKRGDLKLNNETMAVGIFGRLIPSKQPENVVNIAFNLKKRNANFKMFFIGDGPKRNDVENRIKKLGLENDVFILGMKSYPFDYIVSMDVMLHLCEHESMSRALRESMYLERPIIAYDGAGNRELCSGKLKHLLFKDHNQAVKKLYRMALNKSERHYYGKLSKKRVLEMENNAVNELLRLIN